MSREELAPGGNEGEPTWWEEYGHKLLDFEFTFFEIQELGNEVSKVLMDVMRRQKDPITLGITSEKSILLNEFIRKFESKFGERPITLRTIAHALQEHVNEAASGKVSWDAIDRFLALVVDFFGRKHQGLYNQVAQDDEYLDFWDDKGLPANYLDISDEDTNVETFLVDKIHAELEGGSAY